MSDEQINRRIAEITNCAGHGNYCNDLNSMHEAERVLKGKIVSVYRLCLLTTTGAETVFDKQFFCSTARQRAEAFLKVFGKWEEVK